MLQSDASRLVLELDLPGYVIERTHVDQQMYHTISIQGFGQIDEPGAPQLPQRAWLIAVPPVGHVSLTVEPQQIQTIQTGLLLPAPTPTPPVNSSTIVASQCVPEPVVQRLQRSHMFIVQEPEPTVQLRQERHVTPEGVGSQQADCPNYKHAVPDGTGQSISRYIKDESIYQADTFYPPEVAALGERGRLRDQQYVPLLVRPVQYNPVAGLLKYTRSLKLTLTFEPEAVQGQALRAAVHPRPEHPMFEQVLQRAVLNYEVGKLWRVSDCGLEDRLSVVSSPLSVVKNQDKDQQTTDHGPRTTDYGPIPPSAIRHPPSGDPAYKITVDRDGIYQVSYADLQAAGVPVERLDPRTLKLFTSGREVAIRVEGQADGQFDANDAITFMGKRSIPATPIGMCIG